MSGDFVDVAAVLRRTSEGLWSVANNCTRSDLATTMRERAEEFDQARARVSEMLDFQHNAAPLASRIVGAGTEAEVHTACRELAKFYNDDLDRTLYGEGGAS